MKNTFVNTPQWKNMLKDLSLPKDELLVAESIRYAISGSSDLKKIVQDIISVEVDPISREETVCVDRLELMNAINANLAITVDLIPAESRCENREV